MSRFTAYVLVSPDTEDIEGAVIELMAPYGDHNFDATEYETICVCRRVKADRIQQEMSLGRAGVKKELEKLYQEIPLQADKELYWKKVREKEEALFDKRALEEEILREKLLNEAQADPDCPWCVGRGTYRTSVNLFGRWDWYQIGKTKGKNFNKALKDLSKAWGNHYVALVKDLNFEALEIPDAVVTPDGIWHETWVHGAYFIEQLKNPDRHLAALRILEEHKDHLVVYVECHYKTFLKGHTMKINEKDQVGGNESRAEATKLTLRFVCPRCGSRDLRLTLLCASYPTSTLDFLEVDPDGPDDFELHEREPYGEHWSSMTEGWEFACDNCGLYPTLEEDGEERPVETEEDLAEWLLKNCPQEDDEAPVTKDDDAKQEPGQLTSTIKETQIDSETKGEANARLGKPNRFPFTCPICGGNTLYLKQIDLTEVAGVCSDGEISLGKEFPEEDLGFVCGGCAYELRDENSAVIDGSHLVEWLLKNCPQTDEDQPVTGDKPKGD